jgi:DNA-binding LacI/PurR family transcriptional regulator
MSTLKQVAARAGTSVAAVSYVLNGKARENRLSDACIERIERAVRELNYQRNYHAASLPTGRSLTIGLVLGQRSTLLYPFWTQVAAGADSAARSQGYNLLLIGTQEERTSFDVGLQAVQIGRVDGLITYLQAVEMSEAAEAAREVADRLVLIGPAGNRPLPSVQLDPQPGIREAVAHLADLGHREILRLGRADEADDDQEARRSRAFEQACREMGLEGREVVVSTGSLHHADPQGALRRCRQALEPVAAGLEATAVMCFSDLAALALSSLLRRQGLDVPRDVSLIGFDDIEAVYHWPPLTTVSHQLRRMGQEAVNLLIDRATQDNQPATAGQRRVVPASLVLRDSTGKPARRQREVHSP